MNARDGLHAPSVAVTQAAAVHRLGLAHIGAAVLAQRNRVIGWQAARHAGDPEHFLTDRCQRVVLHAAQFIQAIVDGRMDPGD